LLSPRRWGAKNLLNETLLRENVDLTTSDERFIGTVMILSLTKGAQSGINIFISFDGF